MSESFERLTALVITDAGFGLVVPRLELAILKDSSVPGLGEAGVELSVLDWVDGDDPYALVLGLLAGATTVAVADAVPALHLVPLLDRGLSARLATDVLRRLRMIKDAAELDELRAAGAAIDRVHARVGDFLKVGRTEREVADDIAAAIVEEGHTEAAFIIVGSGPHGADPHHEVSDRVVEAGDVVVIDIGGPLASGYNSDCTRTYAMGEPSEEILEQYALLEQAQRASVDAVRPGVSAEAIDAAGRDLLAGAGLGSSSCTGPGTASGCRCTRSPTSLRATTFRSNRAWPSRSSRESTSVADGERGSRISSSSPRTAASP